MNFWCYFKNDPKMYLWFKSISCWPLKSLRKPQTEKQQMAIVIVLWEKIAVTSLQLNSQETGETEAKSSCKMLRIQCDWIHWGLEGRREVWKQLQVSLEVLYVCISCRWLTTCQMLPSNDSSETKEVSVFPDFIEVSVSVIELVLDVKAKNWCPAHRLNMTEVVLSEKLITKTSESIW